MISTLDPSMTLEKLRFMQENQYFDRKRAKVKPVDLAGLISAFANAEGGSFVVGIGDEGELEGISADRENELRHASLDFLPILPIYHAETIEQVWEGKTIRLLFFTVEPYSEGIIKLKDGTVYQRYGDQSRKLTADQVLAMEYSRGVRSYEINPVRDATLADLDMDEISAYANDMKLTYGNSMDLLRARGLVVQKNGEEHITIAGMVMFGKLPSQYLPGVRVRFLRYDGTKAGVGEDINLIKDQTFEGPLPKVIRDTKAAVKSQLRDFQYLNKDGRFITVPEYPEFSWLEGIVNAVTHRDYSIQGDYIRVTMYDDRLEIFSPGCLPRMVTPQNIRETRFSRNPFIARALSDLGYVRELNEGVKRMYADMNDMFLDAPIYQEPGKRSVLLTLKNNIISRTLRRFDKIKQVITLDTWQHMSELEQSVVYYVANIGQATMRQLMDFTGHSRPVLRRTMNHLIAAQIVTEVATSRLAPNKYFTLRLP